MSVYDKVDNEMAEDIADELIDRILNYDIGEIERDGEDGTLYHVQITDTKFDCRYTSGEIESIVRACSCILDELHTIAKNNLASKQLEDACKNEPSRMSGEFETQRLALLQQYHTFATPRLDTLISRLYMPLDKSNETGNEYPNMVEAVCVCYENVINSPDNSDSWAYNVFWLVRNAMRIREQVVTDGTVF